MLFQGGLRKQPGRQGWPAPSRRSGGPASAHGCHGDGRAGGGGCAEKRSLISLAAAPGPWQHWLQRRARLCLPRGVRKHGVLRPEPLGLRAGLGTARSHPALTALPCPAPGGAEAAQPAERFQDAHQGVPHSAAHELGRVPGGPALHDPGEGDGKRETKGAILHDTSSYCTQEHAGRTGTRGWGSAPTSPARVLERAQRPEEGRECLPAPTPLGCRGRARMQGEGVRAVGNKGRRAWRCLLSPSPSAQPRCDLL